MWRARALGHSRVLLPKTLRRHGTVLYRTGSTERLLGWTLEQALERPWTDHVFEEDRARVAAEVDALLRGGDGAIALQFRAVHGDGSLRWVQGSCTNRLDDPDVGALVCNFRDVSAKMLALNAANEGRARLEEAQAIAHVGSWTSGIVTRVLPHLRRGERNGHDRGVVLRPRASR